MSHQPTRTKERIFQFKITLLDVKPPIWRRIQVMDCTLDTLHCYIQAAFGWCNEHLHQFTIKCIRYGVPHPGDLDFGKKTKDESQFAVSQLLKSAGPTAWTYEYDFGDGWRHEIVSEQFEPIAPPAKYPLCLEGKRACPPEDCGGPWGYADYLAAIADPNHEQHQEMLEWQGPFDPQAFDPKEATKKMRKLKSCQR